MERHPPRERAEHDGGQIEPAPARACREREHEQVRDGEVADQETRGVLEARKAQPARRELRQERADDAEHGDRLHAVAKSREDRAQRGERPVIGGSVLCFLGLPRFGAPNQQSCERGGEHLRLHKAGIVYAPTRG